MSDDKHDYEVGYKKPPKHGQFKKGQPSANPRGRRKKSKNFAILLGKGLQETITLTKNGEKKKMTAQEAIVLALITNAMKGSDKAIERIFKFFPEQTPEQRAKHVTDFLDSRLALCTDLELEDLIQGLQQAGKKLREDGE